MKGLGRLGKISFKPWLNIEQKMRKTSRKTKFLISLTILILVSCTNSEADLQRFKDEQAPGVERAEQVELLYSDSARLRTSITAPLMLQYLDPEKPRRTFPQGILVRFYDQQQQPNGQLQARYAEYLVWERKIYLKDSVKVWNDQGESLSTQSLVWSEVDSTLSTADLVKIQTPTEWIMGYGLRANSDFSRWQLDRVTGLVQKQPD